MSTGIMTLKSIAEITSALNNQEVDLQVTITHRSALLPWGNNQFRLSGIFSDKSGKMDFILWNGVAERYDSRLTEGSTYKLHNCKVGVAKAGYSKTGHQCQIRFGANTLVEPITATAMVAPVSIVEMSSLKDSVNGAVNIAGKFLSNSGIHDEDINGKQVPKLQVRIRDNTAEIDCTFWGDSCQNVLCLPGDNVLIEHGVVKRYGQYHCVSMSSGTLTVKPSQIETAALERIDVNANAPTCLSPSKGVIEQGTLSSLLGGKTLRCKIVINTIDFEETTYPRCPARNCRRSVYNIGTSHRCDKCEVDYLVAANGYKLKILVQDEVGAEGSVMIFNEKAEALVGMSADSFHCLPINEKKAICSALHGQKYNFTLTQRNADAFLCSTFDKILPTSSDEANLGTAALTCKFSASWSQGSTSVNTSRTTSTVPLYSRPPLKHLPLPPAYGSQSHQASSGTAFTSAQNLQGSYPAAGPCPQTSVEFTKDYTSQSSAAAAHTAPQYISSPFTAPTSVGFSTDYASQTLTLAAHNAPEYISSQFAAPTSQRNTMMSASTDQLNMPEKGNTMYSTPRRELFQASTSSPDVNPCTHEIRHPAMPTLPVSHTVSQMPLDLTKTSEMFKPLSLPSQGSPCGSSANIYGSFDLGAPFEEAQPPVMDLSTSNNKQHSLNHKESAIVRPARKRSYRLADLLQEERFHDF